jgi:hypothetical protein
VRGPSFSKWPKLWTQANKDSARRVTNLYMSAINMIGQTPNVTGLQNPVSSSGDGGAGRTRSLRSRRFGVRGGNNQMLAFE